MEQQKADLASALERRKASKKAGLQAEPAAGSLNTAAVRIRLPDGSTAQRRFLADQPLQVQCTVSSSHLLHPSLSGDWFLQRLFDAFLAISASCWPAGLVLVSLL